MAKKLDSKETVTFEELLMSNTIEQKALINLLDKKGLINKQELFEEIKRLKNQQGYKIIDEQTGERERELIEDLEQDEDDF